MTDPKQAFCVILDDETESTYLCLAHQKERKAKGQVIHVPLIDGARFLGAITGRTINPGCADCNDATTR